MRQTEIMVGVKHGHLLAQACFLLTEGIDATANRRYMLTEGEVEAVTVDGGITPPTSASKPCVPLSRHTAPQ
jgi:hypothetical protein